MAMKTRITAGLVRIDRSYALDGIPMYQYDGKGYPIRDLSSLE